MPVPRELSSKPEFTKFDLGMLGYDEHLTTLVRICYKGRRRGECACNTFYLPSLYREVARD